MKNKYYFIFACAMVALLAFGACKKKVVDVNKLCKSFTESVVAEQNGLGNTLTVDWNLTTSAGSRLHTGVYLYRVQLSCEGSSYASKANKLIVLTHK
jgi:hypothetical protein